MRVIATDDDQENTLNSQIYYSIAQQSAGMFSINSATGEVFVQRNTLDREVTLTLVHFTSHIHFIGMMFVQVTLL